MVWAEYGSRGDQVSRPSFNTESVLSPLASWLMILSSLFRTLTNAYPHAALSVSLAADAVIFRSDVYAASQPIDSSHSSPEKRAKSGGRRWGGRAVLVLVGVRLGLDGVNPIYHETVKVSLPSVPLD